MQNTLNLYATKIFEEHPNTLWPLDEELGYVDLLGSVTSDLSSWSSAGVDPIDETLFDNDVPSIPSYSLNTTPYFYQSKGTGLAELGAPTWFTIEESSVSTELGSIAFGLYIYTPDRQVDVRIGLSYLDGQGEQQVLRATKVDPVISVPARSRKMWAFVSATFDLPESFSSMSPFIELSYSENEVPYQFAIFGLTLGQWAEEFHAVSSGVATVPLPPEIPIDNSSGLLTAVPARPYGFQGDSGYYLVRNNKLLSRNTGLPLVFGSDNSTTLTPGDGEPSLILPGSGFLNRSGINKELTFEFWANIQSNAITGKRIFGPLSSEDGLYVDKHLLKFKVGSNEGAYSVGEWGRPMLISISLGQTKASVLINGEQVISINIDTSDYPMESEDWLGFYLHQDDVPMMQVECPAVYPYKVPTIVQKRRFVYGQGVSYPTSIRGLNHTSIIAFDHSVANLAKNVRYPQTSSWSSGVSENINANQSGLSLPSYVLPKLYSDSAIDWNDAMESVFSVADPSFTLKPTAAFEEVNSYFYFENTAFLNETCSALFGVFRYNSLPTQKETLLSLHNEISGDTFELFVDETNTMTYAINGQAFFSQDGVGVGSKFVAGIDFIKAQSFGGPVAAFFSNTQSLSMYIGGTSSFDNTFTGDIFRIAMASPFNLDSFNNLFASNGIAAIEEWGIATGSNATYTLVPRLSLNNFSLDIATQSSWKDYVPLSYFAKNVLSSNNEQYKALDFLQFNIDYVKLDRFDGEYYDTSSMPVKTYVSFEYLNNSVDPVRTNIQKLSKLGIVQPGDEWQSTKYEVLNDTIIKFPRGVDKFSLGISIEIVINSEGILSDTVKIRSLELSSVALGNQPNKIPTQFGGEVIPYKRSNKYFEYKSVSPFSIGKEESPYLHLTKYSGLKPRIPFTYAGNEGVSIPINKNKESFFKVDLFQMSMRYDENSFPTAPVQLFEIQTTTDYIRFYLVTDSSTNQRGQVYAIDSNTGSLRSDIVFYVNGNPTKRLIINPKTWSAVSFSFLNSLDFGGQTGALRITSPILFDNLSYYQQSQLDEVQRFAFRKWAAVRSGIDTTLNWDYWQDSTWQEVLFLAETDAELSDAETIYKTFTGTNSFIFDSSSSLVLKNYQSSVYKDLSWTSSIITPV